MVAGVQEQQHQVQHHVQQQQDVIVDQTPQNQQYGVSVEMIRHQQQQQQQQQQQYQHQQHQGWN